MLESKTSRTSKKVILQLTLCIIKVGVSMLESKTRKTRKTDKKVTYTSKTAKTCR
jgi:hypothetical protein